MKPDEISLQNVQCSKDEPKNRLFHLAPMDGAIITKKVKNTLW